MGLSNRNEIIIWRYKSLLNDVIILGDIVRNDMIGMRCEIEVHCWMNNKSDLDYHYELDWMIRYIWGKLN